MDTHRDMLAKLVRVDMLLFCHRVIRKIFATSFTRAGVVDVVVILCLKLPGLAANVVNVFSKTGWKMVFSYATTTTTTKG